MTLTRARHEESFGIAAAADRAGTPARRATSSPSGAIARR